MPDKRLVVDRRRPGASQRIRAHGRAEHQLLGLSAAAERCATHMQRARAFVFAAEEDFGIVPVEAQACGTPVIAYGRGGELETVRRAAIARPSGVFFPEQNVDASCAAVQSFEEPATKRQPTSLPGSLAAVR